MPTARPSPVNPRNTPATSTVSVTDRMGRGGRQGSSIGMVVVSITGGRMGRMMEGWWKPLTLSQEGRRRRWRL